MTASPPGTAPNCITHQLTLNPVSLDEKSYPLKPCQDGTDNRQNDRIKVITPPPRYFEFRNTHLLWHAPDARSIFGGVPLAQCAAAAQHTVPANFGVHSLQGLFIRSGDPALPVRYVVRCVRNSKYSASRVVEGFQQKGPLRPPQNGEVIFSAALSLIAPRKRPNSGDSEVAKGQRISTFPRHTTTPMPENSPSSVPPATHLGPSEDELRMNGVGHDTEAVEVVLASSRTNTAPPTPIHLRRVSYWMKCRTPISAPSGSPVHAQALAYMSDRVFFGVIQRVHNIRRYTTGGDGAGVKSMFRDELGMLRTMYTVKECEAEEELVKAERNGGGTRGGEGREGRDDRTIDFLASMSHTMYFHDLEGFRADEWVLIELESPWADRERGLAVQRMYGRDGRLVASCTQEGMIRLSRPGAKI